MSSPASVSPHNPTGFDAGRHLTKTPYFLCSRKALDGQLKKLELPGMETFYSVKTNPERQILGHLASKDIGFSVSSIPDAEALKEMGVSRMCYYERAMTREKAERASKLGIKSFTVDSKASLGNVLPFADEVFIRVRLDNVKNAYSGKFTPGFSIEESRQLLKDLSSKGKEIGILHHSSSQLCSPEYWRKKFELISGFLDSAPVGAVNLGGGLPVQYSGPKIREKEVLGEIKKGVKQLGVRTIIEPGRFIIGPACSLITRVEVLNDDEAVLDCSVYKAHMDAIIAGIILKSRVAHGISVGEIVLKSRTEAKGKPRKYKLLGNSLCSLDVFDPEASLTDLSEGDYVIFENAGAYNFSSDFVSGEKPRTHMSD